MCILIHQPKDACFSSEQLADFYSRNPDGFGAIVKNGSSVEVIKSIGTLAEIEDLYYSQVACYEAVIHFRMKTHGEIDIANCHPYEVVPGIWMAHNGILSTGNAKDPKMSDTWHYIQDYLKPLLQAHPDLMKDEAFLKLVGGHIGSNNKFAFMNQDGDVGIVNKTAGYTYWDLANDKLDVWYSNTYAWSPYKFGFEEYVPPKSYPTTSYGKGTYYGSSPTWRAWDAYDKEERQGTLSFGKGKAKTKRAKRIGKGKSGLGKLPKYLTGEGLKRIIRQAYNAVSLDGYDGALRWVVDHPMAAMNFLYQIYGDEDNPSKTKQEISDRVNFDQEWAADDVMLAWETLEDDLLELGGIVDVDTVGGKQHVNV